MVAQESSRPAVVSSPIGPSHTAAPKRVLIVEDHVDSVRTLAALLHDMGHQVQYAINGYAALEIARRFRPHIVLLDLGLPGMDGFDVCSRLKHDPLLKDARVIVISAYGSAEHRIRSQAAGCEMHLQKPVSAHTLFDVLESSPRAATLGNQRPGKA